jgi:uncharacterized membrane protein
MTDEDDHESVNSRLLHRMLFFSDAVFAIVLTLLVLELRPPEAHSPAEAVAGLAGLAEHFVAFVTSFALVSVFWIAHMSTLRRLHRFDWPVAVTNLVVLAPICLLPFASSLLGAAKFGLVAWRFYSWNLIATSVAVVALVLAVNRGGGRLVGGNPPGEQVYRALRAAAPGVGFAVSLVCLEAGLIALARLAVLLIPLQILLADRFANPARKRVAKAPEPEEA